MFPRHFLTDKKCLPWEITEPLTSLYSSLSVIVAYKWWDFNNNNNDKLDLTDNWYIHKPETIQEKYNSQNPLILWDKNR